MNAHKTATEATTVATVGLQGALGLIGIALLAVSAVVSIVSKGIANKNEKTQESIRLANESVGFSKQESNNLTELKKTIPNISRLSKRVQMLL